MWCVEGVGGRVDYSREDGCEISGPGGAAWRIWNTLLADERVRPIGLGARDSLRLEAGLPLYGHDLDETVSPIEAGLGFAVSKKRRDARDFPGASRIAAELAGEVARKAVGLKVEGAPAREGAEIADADRSEEHTSELQSRRNLVCRLLLGKKKKRHRHGEH